MEQNLSGVPCICFHARRAARHITQIFDSCLRAEGLRASQYGLLYFLSKTEGACISDIGRLLRMDQSTVTRNIDSLSRAALVLSSPHPEDPRKKVVQLTEKGKEKLEHSKQAWQRAQNQVKAQMGERQFAELADLLRLAAMD